jgi:hypothetical protein
MAVRIEDGDGFARANRAVTMEALIQLHVLGEGDLRALATQHQPVTAGPEGTIIARTTPEFELAPISELL